MESRFLSIIRAKVRKAEKGPLDVSNGKHGIIGVYVTYGEIYWLVNYFCVDTTEGMSKWYTEKAELYYQTGYNKSVWFYFKRNKYTTI